MPTGALYHYTKERPILFSGEMVRAILDGRKTQTRRAVKPRQDWFVDERENGQRWPFFQPYVYAEPEPIEVPCPYGNPGDRLWVKETHAIVPSTAYAVSTDDGVSQIPHRRSPNSDHWVVYREGWSRCTPGRWRPSIHMPRWASRVLLEVTAVRVERVQEISHADALAEGIEASPVSTPAEAFKDLWNSINGKRGFGWEANPWVWVVEFKRVFILDLHPELIVHNGGVPVEALDRLEDDEP